VLTGLSADDEERADVDLESRDISRGEEIEKDLDAMIRRRHDKRVESEGERRERELWAEIEERFAQKRRAQNRAAWAAYHRQQAQRHRATLTDLVVFHEAQARKYMGNAHHHNTEGAA
jgi:hypothetical protein